MEYYEASILLSYLASSVGYDNYITYVKNKFISEDLNISHNTKLIWNFIREHGILHLSKYQYGEPIYNDQNILKCNVKLLSKKKYDNIDDYLIDLRKEYINNVFINEFNNIDNNIDITFIKKQNDIKIIMQRPYEPNKFNNCIFSSIIGLVYKNDIDKLIDFTIKSCALVSMNSYAFLSSVANAYISSLAIEKIDINKWIYMLLELFESDKIDIYIKKNFINIFNIYKINKNYVIEKIKTYIELNFNEKTYVVDEINVVIPGYHFMRFSTLFKHKDEEIIGSHSITSILLSYDVL